ncbi:hypothetical protein [Chelativorans xinjiangense]|uniref:hypothetical protein n=1 Tax=Chelativorans xinjiangense TaxID=2681485 RepID=UPI00135CEC4F|nr:hypothetical protein [Chelativorans xinjiangense]
MTAALRTLSAGGALLLLLSGCYATEPRAVPVAGGGDVMTSTCRSTLFTLTEAECRKQVLSKCKPGASVLNVETSSRLAYTPQGYMEQTFWTYFIKGCR